MFINYEMATIEITKAEAKEAGVFKSEMYENLKEAREATGYKVVVKDTKRKADTMKGLTYAYMTIYIEKKAVPFQLNFLCASRRFGKEARQLGVFLNTRRH